MAPTRIDPHQLNALKVISPARFTLALLSEYALLAGLLYVGTASIAGPAWSWAAWPLLWALIASRQHAILILMHDATHNLAFRQNWLNDFVGEVFCSGPVGVSMMSYRRDHLAHHKWINSEKDPDWRRKLEDPIERQDWSFPKTNTGAKFWIRLWYRSIAYQFRSLGDNSKATKSNVKQTTVAKRVHQLRLLSYLLLAIALTAFGVWLQFLMFWALPVLLFLPFIMRIRSIAEHFAIDHRDELSEARNVVFKSLIEKMFFAPHNVALHLDHHLFAAVPFYRLPQLHAALREDADYCARAHINDGYLVGKNTLMMDFRNRAPSRELWPEPA